MDRYGNRLPFVPIDRSAPTRLLRHACRGDAFGTTLQHQQSGNCFLIQTVYACYKRAYGNETWYRGGFVGFGTVFAHYLHPSFPRRVPLDGVSLSGDEGSESWRVVRGVIRSAEGKWVRHQGQCRDLLHLETEFPRRGEFSPDHRLWIHVPG